MPMLSVKYVIVLIWLEGVAGDRQSCEGSPDDMGLLQVRSSQCTIMTSLSAPASTTQVIGFVELGYHGKYGAVSVAFPRFSSPESPQVIACFDTGSADTWVQLSTCRVVETTDGYPKAALEPEPLGTTPCVPGAGSYMHGPSTQCYAAQYGPSSGIAGYGIQATVTLGNNSFLSSVGAIQYYAATFPRNDVGAILGVGPAPIGDAVGPPSFVLTNDALGMRSAEGYFTLCLPQCEPSTPGYGSCYPPSYEQSPGSYSGFACFGCEPACDIPGAGDNEPWYTTSVIADKVQGFWQYALPLQSIQAAGKSATADYNGSIFGAVLVDSGTALIQLSQKEGMFKSVFDAMEGAMSCSDCCTTTVFAEPTVQTENVAMLKCVGLTLEDWPKFSVTFGNVNLEIDPKYFVTVNGTESAWTVELGDSEDMSIILGAVVFNQFYTKFSGLGETDPTNLTMAFKGDGVMHVR